MKKNKAEKGNRDCAKRESSILNKLVRGVSMDWIFISSQNLCLETLIPTVMVLGNGAFGR